MSTSYYTYSSYEQERKRRRAEWEAAPKECPYCLKWQIHTPINQHFSEYGNSKPRYHCGSDRCRAAAYRQRKAERLQAAREDADARINRYAAQLPQEQAAAVRAMRDVLMRCKQPDYQHGHEQALAIIEVIERQRCKHDRIQTLIDNAALEKRRAVKAEEHWKELKAIYERRIEELEAEIKVYQTLERAIHHIADDQQLKQPDQERPTTPAAEPEDPDRARVLATLAHIGIRPTEQALAEQGEDDDPEGGEGEEDETEIDLDLEE
jgi:hypothetical protein